MRKILPINLLLLACFVLPSCSDHIGTVALDEATGPEAPINDPDSGIFDPSGPGDTGSANNGGGGEGGGGQNGGGGTGSGGSGTGKQPGNPNGPSTVGEEPEGGGGGGQPVPEPGTLLLVGSGLAGISASLLRRRRKRDEAK